MGEWPLPHLTFQVRKFGILIDSNRTSNAGHNLKTASDTKDHMVYESIYIKCLENVSLYRQKEYQWFPRVGHGSLNEL